MKRSHFSKRFDAHKLDKDGMDKYYHSLQNKKPAFGLLFRFHPKINLGYSKYKSNGFINNERAHSKSQHDGSFNSFENDANYIHKNSRQYLNEFKDPRQYLRISQPKLYSRILSKKMSLGNTLKSPKIQGNT